MEFNATLIVAFISFVIFIVIMNQILYKPVGNIIEARKNLIEGNYQNARANKKKSENVLQDRLDKLKNARSRVREETTLALNKIKDNAQTLEKSAKEETGRKIEENINILHEDKKEAINTLKCDVINLAQAISDKFIEASEKISEVDNETIEKIMQD